MENDKDYIIQFKVKNGPLLRAMRARGLYTVKSLQLATGVNLQTIYRYLALSVTPLRKNGSWSGSIKKISVVLRVSPEFLFPEQHLHTPLELGKGEVEVGLDDIQAIIGGAPGYLDSAERDEMLRAIAAVLQLRLTPRQRDVIERRFGLCGPEETLDEVGNALGISAGRVGQLEKRALQKLRSTKYDQAGGFLLEHGVSEFLAGEERPR